jgi:transketolase
LDYGTNGISHFGIDDIGTLRVQPGMALIAPCDDTQVQSALRTAWNMPGPAYFRLSKLVRREAAAGHRFTLGETQTVRAGKHVLLVALGTMVHDALAAADLLMKRGIDAAVELVDNLNAKPLKGLAARMAHFDVVITVESHYVNGGVGSMVCELAAENALGCRVIRCGVPSVPDGITGDRDYLHDRYGISPAQIAARAAAALGD